MSRTQIVDTVDEAVAGIEDGSTVLVGGFAGDLANWSIGAEGGIPAAGGAMDLAIGARDVYVMMTLFAKKGRPKLVPEWHPAADRPRLRQPPLHRPRRD